MKIYKSIDVWKKIDEKTSVRFRCFQISEEAAYCVQSADIYHYPLDKNQINYLDRQYIELFLEENPDIRSNVYPTLEEAIRAHEDEFREYGGL